jgi:hypothetical protein
VAAMKLQLMDCPSSKPRMAMNARWPHAQRRASGAQMRLRGISSMP